MVSKESRKYVGYSKALNKELETNWDNPKNWIVKSDLPESQVLPSIKFSD